MKSQLQFILGICLIAFVSCSSDDSIPNNQLGVDNGFQFNNTAYITNTVYVTVDNQVVLSNQFLSPDGSAENVDVASFTTSNNLLEPKSYFVGDGLSSCQTVTEGQITQGNIANGQIILGDNNVASGFFRILKINRVKKEISLLFEFQRTDGELVAGSFNGNYEIGNF